eukprot:m.135327 g.135327  ORF g.135327 m.135327 type:complete len:365 (+) comp9906_c0_seq1:195-1289(+)
MSEQPQKKAHTTALVSSSDDEKVFTVDFHTHILPKSIPDFSKKFGSGGYIMLRHKEGSENADMYKGDTFFREIEPNCWDPKVRIEQMTAQGVDVQVLSTVPVMFAYNEPWENALEVAMFLNDDLANTCAKYPKRFVAVGSVPLQNPEAAAIEARRCMEDLHLSGIQIGSHINEWNLDAPELEPFWKVANDLEIPILVHPWDMKLDGRFSKFWAPWLVGMPMETTLSIMTLLMSGVLERHPKLRLCFAHGGGSFAYTLGRINHGFTARPDLCQQECTIEPKEYVRRRAFWVDSAVHDDGALNFLVSVMGEDRVMLGSDFPFPLGEQEVGKCVRDNHHFEGQPEKKRKLLGSNCFEFFKLKESDFQ